MLISIAGLWQVIGYVPILLDVLVIAAVVIILLLLHKVARWFGGYSSRAEGSWAKQSSAGNRRLHAVRSVPRVG